MAIKFTEGSAKHLVFPYGEFREIDGMYGPQFMYTVEGSGRPDRLFASLDLHRAIQNAGVSPGAELRITATRGERRRRIWLVTPSHTPRKAQAAPTKTDGQQTETLGAHPTPRQEEEPAESCDRQPTSGNGHDPASLAQVDDEPSVTQLLATNGDGSCEAPLPDELEQMGRLMGLCLRAATMAWKQAFHGRQNPGDVRAVAITLFLECSRRGVSPEEILQDIPS